MNNIVFNSIIDLKGKYKGYKADIGENKTFKEKYYAFLIVADMRLSTNPDLTIIPAKVVEIKFPETMESYRMNTLVLEEILYEEGLAYIS